MPLSLTSTTPSQHRNTAHRVKILRIVAAVRIKFRLVPIERATPLLRQSAPSLEQPGAVEGSWFSPASYALEG
ncbi:unnamed protein product [Fusarium venenatum]|uniref:Uncharacterized protein n=1 Tax=Fusarium venenatum TaxID=56646 RepID=A0A2L2TE63_9HYPO|nr:uncharacterized protein FVRRES_12533 [Fusarium venenatum]CEI39842.1 unnamed protein product [Fusarium venenatum]